MLISLLIPFHASLNKNQTDTTTSKNLVPVRFQPQQPLRVPPEEERRTPPPGFLLSLPISYIPILT